MSRLFVLLGATAVGKSTMAISVARSLECPILSCDSRQFYREMSIGTAVPSLKQRAQAHHYFIQDRSVQEPLSAGEYEKEAFSVLRDVYKVNNSAILVGGSGLYINALLYGMDDLPSNKALREVLSQRAKTEGLRKLATELKELDIDTFQAIDQSNPARVIRALEVSLLAGVPYSSLLTKSKTERDFKIIKIGLRAPRQELYDRINLRVDQMMVEGLEQEARRVLPYRELSSLQTVGYREMFDYFDGRITREQATELIKRNTRRYAKRQLTWMRPDTEIQWFDRDDFQPIMHYIDGID
ncbi:MAG: tRNA (adenosine(37)-N6)-dimethylallyltransferase MiaA [Mucinivorans sp.]